MGNATIKDVAKAAGVSIATVSRVLNKNYTVSPKLEEKVMNVIKELNYYPNSIARSLKNENTHTIGLIVSDISNSFFTTIARSVEDIINQQNYNLIVCSTDNQQKKEYDYLLLLMEKKVDGIIINTTGKNDEFIATISQTIPIALCGRTISSPSFKGDYVDSDNISGTYELIKYFIELGHTKIGIINGQANISSAIERFEGFKRAMLTIGVKADENYPYLFNGDFNRMESGYKGAEFLLTKPDPPTAIFVTNNELIYGTLRYIRQHDISIPEDVRIGCYGELVNGDLFYVQPTCVSMSPQTHGARLAELIMDRIQNKNNVPNKEIRFSPHLIK